MEPNIHVQAPAGHTAGDVQMLGRISGILERGATPVNRLLYHFSWLLTGLMPIPIFVDVTLRFVFGKSIPGIIEIEEFMLVCIVFCAIPFMQTIKEHIDIDILVQRFSSRTQTILSGSIYLILAILLGTASWQLTANALRKTQEVSFALGIPVSIFIGVAALGSALLALVFLKDFLTSLEKMLSERSLFGPAFMLALPFLIYMSPVLLGLLAGDLDGLVLGILGMIFLFVLLLLRMPIGFAMALTGFLGMWILTRGTLAPLRMIGSAPYTETASFIMAVVPLFIFMGELALYSGIPGVSEHVFHHGMRRFCRCLRGQPRDFHHHGLHRTPRNEKKGIQPEPGDGWHCRGRHSWDPDPAKPGFYLLCHRHRRVRWETLYCRHPSGGPPDPALHLVHLCHL